MIKIDLIGQRFGRLLVIEKMDERYKDGTTIWKCLCDCGNIKYVSSQYLKRGSTRSCGCIMRNNLVGKKINYLTVVECLQYIKNDEKNIRWRCICTCGKEVITTTTRLRHQISCGCMTKRKKPHESGLNSLYDRYRRGAIKRGLSFRLSKGRFIFLTSQNCYYCGKPPSRVYKVKVRTGSDYGNYIYNGVDRVNNKKGYSIENCVTCCAECNNKKKDITLDMARKMIEFIDKDK